MPRSTSPTGPGTRRRLDDHAVAWLEPLAGRIDGLIGSGTSTWPGTGGCRVASSEAVSSMPGCRADAGDLADDLVSWVAGISLHAGADRDAGRADGVGGDHAAGGHVRRDDEHRHPQVGRGVDGALARMPTPTSATASAIMPGRRRRGSFASWPGCQLRRDPDPLYSGSISGWKAVPTWGPCSAHGVVTSASAWATRTPNAVPVV